MIAYIVNEDFISCQENAFKLLKALQDRNPDQRIKQLRYSYIKFILKTPLLIDLNNSAEAAGIGKIGEFSFKSKE